MRSFIAIDFSETLKKQIADLQKELKSHADAGRWKYIDNFHLTLKFLDDIDHNQFEKISKELEAVCSKTAKFNLHISELGYFNGKGCLRVLWLGLGGEIDKLRKLQGEIDKNLEKIGFKPEKRAYTPHVTIGQDVVFKEPVEKIKEKIFLNDLEKVCADRVYLFKSEQIGNKRVYTPVREFQFKI